MIDATALGLEAARQVRAEFGDVDLDMLVERMGVAVETSDRDGGYGTVIVFADYTPRPPTIRLYRGAIATLDARLGTYPDRDLLPDGTRAVFLAHELFHHWEALHPDQAPSRRDRALSEAAAGAFAQSLLGLRHPPSCLEKLAIGPSQAVCRGTSAAHSTLLPQHLQEAPMGFGRGILLWLLGIPLPIIILLAIFWR